MKAQIDYFVDNAGSGFEKMFNGWTAYYEDEPVISGDVDFYKITFPLVKLGEASENVGEKVGERFGERFGVKLTENQEKIIDFIQKEPTISAKELSKLVGISLRKIEVNLSKLKVKGLLRRIGAARGGYWEVVKK